MKTNAQFAISGEAAFEDGLSDMHAGLDTGLFTTSMAPFETDMMMGAGTELFTTSMVSAGEGTGLYTTSMVAGSDALAGDATGLFTTSMSNDR